MRVLFILGVLLLSVYHARAVSVLPMPARGEVVVFLTDLEGSRAKLAEFYTQSGYFHLGTDDQYHLNDNVIFVYGGDVTDRYLGSVWVTQELLRLHEEAKTRMFVILGNRDVVKLRFPLEFSEAALAEPPFRYSFLKPDPYNIEAQLPLDPARRLKYALTHAMGAPQYFELMREEIGGDPDEQMLFNRFMHEYGTQGNFSELLLRMNLALRIGNTLFVHGGLTPENFLNTPGNPKSLTVNQWIANLHQWYQQQINEWRENADAWRPGEARPGDVLIHYPLPQPNGRQREDSIVAARHVDAHNNPKAIHAEVEQQLLAEGVQRVMYGHTPIGDFAVTVRAASGNFETVFGDTSYTQKPNNVTWVELSGENLSVMKARGMVQINNQWIKVEAQTQMNLSSLIGIVRPNGFRVIAQINEQEFVATRMENYNILNQVVSRVQLQREIACHKIFAF